MKDLNLLIIIAENVLKEFRDRREESGPFLFRDRALSRGVDPDRLAEDIALEILDSESPKWNIISEESDFKDKGSDITLIMDPVDGTFNAKNNIPFYSVSLALADRDLSRIRCGLVENLYTGDRYWSEKGGGSYLNGVRLKTKEFDPERSVFSTYMGAESVNENRILNSYFGRSRYMGSTSLELCNLAAGGSDIFCMMGRIPRIFDVAASKLILEEAGGGMKSYENGGSLAEYKLAEANMRRRGVIAYGDSAGLRTVVRLLNDQDEGVR